MALRSLTPVAITALPNASTPLSGTEAVAVVQSGTTSQVAVSDLTAGRAVSASALTASSGNLTFSGTAQRITGDMSNATVANRLMFQTSTANTATIVGALPSGTGTEARYSLFNSSDTANSSTFDIRCTSTEVALRNSVIGTGTYLPMTFYTGGSERMRIDTSGRVLVGTSSSVNDTFGASLFQVSNTDGNLASYGRYSNDAFSPIIYLRKSRGALGAQGAVSSGDALGAFLFTGSDGTGFIQGATIKSEVDGTPGTNNMPGRLVFSTTASGSSSPAERMRIDSSGNVGIGTASPAYTLDINATSGTFRVRNSTGGNDFSITNAAGPTSLAGSVANTAIGFMTNNTERMRIDASGNIVAGASAALATTATDGFVYVPTCAGTPTGTPTAITGMAPIVVNTTNNKLYFYSGGAWRDAGP